MRYLLMSSEETTIKRVWERYSLLSEAIESIISRLNKAYLEALEKAVLTSDKKKMK